MAGNAHDCPAGDCKARVAAHMLMCRPHWYMVPVRLRTAVWNAWDGGRGAGTPEHRDAIMAAIEAVKAKLSTREASDGQ